MGTASVPAPAGAADPQREGGWREGLTGRCGRVPARRRHPAYGRGGGDRRMDWPAAAAEGRGRGGGGMEGSMEACRVTGRRQASSGARAPKDSFGKFPEKKKIKYLAILITFCSVTEGIRIIRLRKKRQICE